MKKEGFPPTFQRPPWPPVSDEVRNGLRILQNLLDPRDSIFLAMWRRALGNQPIPGAYHLAVLAAYDWISEVLSGPILAPPAPPPVRRGKSGRRYRSADATARIMAELALGVKQRLIAERYGVSQQTISRIKKKAEAG